VQADAHRKFVPSPTQSAPAQQPFVEQSSPGLAHTHEAPARQTLEPLFSGAQQPPEHAAESEQVAAQKVAVPFE
jgi:hypothetical protein